MPNGARDPRDDLLTALLQAEEAGDQMNEDELLAMVFVLLIAGHETTVNLIGSGTLALLQHPDELARLRQEPTLIRPAIEELLRFVSPVETATERYAVTDLTLAGVAIQRGELVLAALASANRDEQVFAQADILDITRAKNKHLAFGQGSHYCLGAPLARMEGAIAINLLAQRLPDLHLAVPAAAITLACHPNCARARRPAHQANLSLSTINTLLRPAPKSAWVFLSCAPLHKLS